tara:strand:- start:5822 stop:6304 length:483 start_codon:yes stop_codon:yes gene_type:complete
MIKKLNKKFIFCLLIFVSLILISAFIIEYKLDYKPCKLCLYERIPYFLSIVFLIKILLIKNYDKIALLILFFLFFISSILAFYHFGIEQGFFKESLACTTENFAETLSKEQLLEQLKQNTLSCKDVDFAVFGFSLAAINAMLSIVLSVIFIRLFINYGKN